MSHAPRVILVEPVGFCLRSAEAYGDMVYLFPCRKSRPPILSQEFQVQMLNQIAEVYRPEHDYILLAGQQIATAFLLAFVMTHFTPTPHLLVWDAREDSRGYVELKVQEG